MLQKYNLIRVLGTSHLRAFTTQKSMSDLHPEVREAEKNIRKDEHTAKEMQSFKDALKNSESRSPEDDLTTKGMNPGKVRSGEIAAP